ncbi:telomere-linked helicase 1, partial [Rhypophila decipiens]
MVHPSALASVQAIDRLCLDTVVSLLDHQYTHTHYESAMISGLAVIGIREDGGWESVENYTPIYSAVIKMARMLVVYQAVLEQQDEIKELEQRMSKEEAKAAATGLFTIVRKKVRRFLVVVGEKTEPGPIDWIFDARTYGMRIRYRMTAAPAIDWVGERISYQRIRFHMHDLSDMLHGLVEEMRAVMGRLLLVEGDNFGLVLRVESAVRQYGAAVDMFREGMLTIMHMLGGMPARSWELLEIRHSNTANGGVRNIIIDRGMVCFVTLYHKNYRSSEQVKIIHRYLPREAGELLVWYLWLVLPFWQQVQGIVKGADDASGFLWADEIVQQAGRGGEAGFEEGIRFDEEGGEVESPDDEGEGRGRGERNGGDKEVDWIHERKWTADRMRRIMQGHSGRFLGVRIGISPWRHIAIGISNRYLNQAFQEDEKGAGEFDEDDEDTIDSAWDLQAGHSTHTAGMIYARELQQGP